MALQISNVGTAGESCGKRENGNTSMPFLLIGRELTTAGSVILILMLSLVSHSVKSDSL